MLSLPSPPVRRPARLLAVGTLLAVVGTAGAAVPVSAGPGSPPGPVDRPALRQALRDLPSPVVTAAQVRVARPGRDVEVRGGVRDLVSGRAVPPETRFRVASITKAFTAVLVLRLVGRGRIELDAPVQQYLPHLLPPAYPPIPVRTLLDHTSGLPHSSEDEGYDDPGYFAAHRFDYFSPRDVVASAGEHPMVFEPGTKQEYNGVNYFVAGLLLEKVTGHSYGRQLRRGILAPLALRQTRLPGRRDATIGGPHSHGYVTVDGRPVDVTAQSPYGWAESGIVSTTADLRRFLRALLGGRLLPRPQQRELFRVPDVPYVGDDCRGGQACYSSGLTRTELPGGLVVWGKSGSVPGTTAAVFATRDGRRLLSYVLHPTGNRDGSEGAVIQRVVTAAFGLGSQRR